MSLPYHLALPTPPESVDDDADCEFPTAHSRTTLRPPPRPPNAPLLAYQRSPEPHPPASHAHRAPYSPASPVRPAFTSDTSDTHQPRPRRWPASEPFWLLLYFLFNLGLTLFNKLVLVRFPFPYTLTALHAFAGTLGSYAAMELGYFTPARLTSRESLVLTAFSFLYTINIAISNLSLNLVTIPFHQVVRAATPLFIILLTPLLTPLFSPVSQPRRSPSLATLLSLLPIILGVALATYGDYYFTLWGLVLTLLGTVLAALKTIVTHALQTGGTGTGASAGAGAAGGLTGGVLTNPPGYPWDDKDRGALAGHPRDDPHPHALAGTPAGPSRLSRLTRTWPRSLARLTSWLRLRPRPRPHASARPIKLHPLDLLLRMSPLAFVQCVLYAQLSGELDRVRAYGAGAAAYGGARAGVGAGVTADPGMSIRKAAALAVNAAMAFGLNVVSFTANSKVGPLSITVAANVKQVLTILLSVSLFSLTITPANGAGIGLTLLGGAWYAVVEYREKRARARGRGRGQGEPVG